MEHIISRHRYELKRRELTVQTVQRLTPCMQRIVFTGEDLADFESLSADDHVKLFFVDAQGEPTGRDYTPRAFDPQARTLTIDFALHEDDETGPATRWALQARPGDMLVIGGPRGSTIVPESFDWWLLIGDESALPSIGRRLEVLPAGMRVTSLITVTGVPEQQLFHTATRHELIWVHRPAAAANNPEPVLAALRRWQMPPGDGFVWVASEATVARAVRAYLTEERGHKLGWMKSSGYWLKGTADAHDKG